MTPKNVYLFDNGNLAVFDENGEQMPELQGTYSIELHKRILLEADITCKFEGFDRLPFGFNKSAQDFANYFKNKKMTWEQITNL